MEQKVFFEQCIPVIRSYLSGRISLGRFIGDFDKLYYESEVDEIALVPDFMERVSLTATSDADYDDPSNGGYLTGENQLKEEAVSFLWQMLHWPVEAKQYPVHVEPVIDVRYMALLRHKPNPEQIARLAANPEVAFILLNPNTRATCTVEPENGIRWLSEGQQRLNIQDGILTISDIEGRVVFHCPATREELGNALASAAKGLKEAVEAACPLMAADSTWQSYWA